MEDVEKIPTPIVRERLAYSIQEYAYLLGVNYFSVYRLIQCGKLPSATVAIRRVRERVRKGGHSVPVNDIRRRYKRSLRNLVSHYLPLVDEWAIFDNSGREPRLVADGAAGQIRVMDEALYRQIQSGRI